MFNPRRIHAIFEGQNDTVIHLDLHTYTWLIAYDSFSSCDSSTVGSKLLTLQKIVLRFYSDTCVVQMLLLVLTSRNMNTFD